MELERFVYQSGEMGGREQIQACFGAEQPLTVFIRALVGLDRTAAKQAFADFISEQQLDNRQIRFVAMIIDHLTARGTMSPALLYEAPFTGMDYEGLDGVFPAGKADTVVRTVRTINNDSTGQQMAWPLHRPCIRCMV